MAETESTPDARPCRACGRPFSPTHDSSAPGPTVRHPYFPVPTRPVGGAGDRLHVDHHATMPPRPPCEHGDGPHPVGCPHATYHYTVTGVAKDTGEPVQVEFTDVPPARDEDLQALVVSAMLSAAGTPLENRLAVEAGAVLDALHAASRLAPTDLVDRLALTDAALFEARWTLRQRNREYGRASAEIGRLRDQLAATRADRAALADELSRMSGGWRARVTSRRRLQDERDAALAARTAPDDTAALPADWWHCSPALLAAGVPCGPTPRRACQCETRGSHDHLVDRSFADEALAARPATPPPTEPDVRIVALLAMCTEAEEIAAAATAVDLVDRRPRLTTAEIRSVIDDEETTR